MKSVFTGCIIACLFMCLTSVRAQGQLLISYSCEDCSLDRVFNDLNDRFELVFAYESNSLRELKVTVGADQMELDSFLRSFLEPHRLIARKIRPGHYSILKISANPLPKSTYLEGRVVQADSGKPLPFASIRISERRGVSAGEDGRFLLSVSPPYPDSMTVTYLGYEPVTVACQFFQDMLIALTPVMTSIDDIVITDDNRQRVEVQDGGSVIEIDPRSLHLMSGLGEPDLIRSLQLLPGLTSANERASGLFIRGATPAENLILFDGITVYQPGHFFGLLSAFNSDAIKEVTMYRSGTGARYGGRTGGVIDIAGKPGRIAQTSANVSVNLMNARFMVQVPWAKNKGGLLISARRSYTDIAPSIFFQQLFDNRFQEGVIFFDRQQQQENMSTLNTRLFYYDVNAKWLYRPNDRDLISITAVKTGDELDYSLRETQPNRLSVKSEDQLNLANQGVSLQAARQWNSTHYTRINTSWSGFRNQYQFSFQLEDDSLLYRSDLLRAQWLQDYALRLDHRWELPADLTFLGGYHRNMIFLENVLSLDDNLESVSEDTIPARQNLNAVFGELSWKRKSAGAEAGLRAHLLDGDRKLYAEPRLMLYWQPSDHWRIQANAGRYHQFLNYVQVDNQLQAGEDIWVVADGDSVEVMRSDVASFSLSWNSDILLIQAESYVKRQSGLLAYDPTYNDNLNETDLGELLTNGEGRVAGLEFMIQKKTGVYTGWISYTYSRVWQRFPGNDESGFVPASHDRPHQLAVLNQVQYGPWELSATWIYASGIPFTPATDIGGINLPNGDVFYFLEFGQRNSQRLPSYHRLDLTATHTWRFPSGSLRTGISIFNVYGRRNIGNRVFAVNRPQVSTHPASLRTLDKPLLGFTPNLFISLQL